MSEQVDPYEVDVFDMEAAQARAGLLLRKDLRKAAETLSLGEVRFLVDTYYQWQDFRIASGHQARTLTEAGEPHDCIAWTQGSLHRLEKDVAAVLDSYTRTESTGMGEWARQTVGIGPIIAAGLCAHLDITKAPTVGHWWRFAGLDPTNEWLGKEKARELVQTVTEGAPLREDQVIAIANLLNRRPENVRKAALFAGKDKPLLEAPTATSLSASLARRPWNARLKVLAYKIGESFVKVSGNPRDVYGKVYLQRKEYEAAKNERGDYAEQANAALARYRIGADTKARGFYDQGKLPPGHLHARARRYAVKLFIAAYHDEAFRRHYGTEPPLPYAVVHLQHAHVV